jgi:hypothetical protein
MIRCGRRVLQISVLAAILITPVPHSLARVVPDDGVSEEEYGIYASAIQQFYLSPEARPTKFLMIEERTFKYDFSVGDNDEPWKEKHKSLNIEESTGEDYETKNSQKWLLKKDNFKLPVKHDFITDLDLKAIFHGHWGELEWIQYYRRFPESTGFIMLSRVGFNTAHTQALLYIGSRCGPGCGEIHFLFLEKSNGAWVVKKELRKKSFG